VKSLWSDTDADRAIARYGQQGVCQDLALRVYTTRLLGGEPRLVLHGGGNTSVKTQMEDVTGETVEVLCVKGSGWDMASIEPAGLPAVRLAALRELEALDALSDEDMVNLQRRNLLDSKAPNPSVEALFHAFLPHKYVDHTHANAVLALTDQPEGAALCAEVFGTRAAVVPYLMAGFTLAKRAARIQAENPDCEGLILLKHGIFSFGESAREAYERMIALVSLAEARLPDGKRQPFVQARLPAALATPAAVAPILRGLLAIETDAEEGLYKRFVLTFRSDAKIRDFVGAADLPRLAQAGPVTPDHSIRTKPTPLIVSAPAAGDLDGFAAAAAEAAAVYRARYRDYFARNNARYDGSKQRLDESPRVVLVPGLGLFAAGESAKAANVAADLAEAMIAVVSDAEAVGRFESITEAEIFDIEYWSLEQAKLGKAQEPALARHIVAVTGGAGTIGVATAAAFKAEGAELALLDREAGPLEAAAQRLGALPVACDVTDRASVAAALDRIAETYGGIDILVSNAGAIWQGPIGEVDEATLRDSFELNFFAHQAVAQAALAIMRRQKTGGVLLFNASKQAINPGPKLGPYGLAKAATLALMRQYAIDHGAEGIRANAVNADRIRSGILTDDMIGARAKAREVSEADYMAGNLLQREVKAVDVAQAFLALALARKTTGAVLTVDGGNVAAALR